MFNNMHTRHSTRLWEINRQNCYSEKIGTLAMDEDEDWLLIPDYYDEYQYSLENQDQNLSPFGINKADQVRGLINLFTAERNPQKRIIPLSKR